MAVYINKGWSGAALISAERGRQKREEHYHDDHDDEHDCNEIALAAACYAAPEEIYLDRGPDCYIDPWPWAERHDKRKASRSNCTVEERVTELIKAGALIAAEIDRLHRLPEVK